MKKFLLLSSLFAIFACEGALHDIPHITLTAQAILKKPADELQMKISVVTSHEDAGYALSENSQKMKTIIQNLQDAGLGSDDFETAQFAIHPTYTPYPAHPPANWIQTINGYEVTNTLFVHTQDIDQIGNYIGIATKSGATNISDIKFGIRSPELYRQEALALAGKNAIRDAEILAKSTGVKLIRVLSMNINQMHVRSHQVPMACFAKAANDMAPPIEAGDLTIEASVNLTYEIN